MKRKKKLTFHEKIHHHLGKHIHRHLHKVLYFVNHMHHHLFHSLELIVVTMVTLTSLGFADLTGLNQDLYRANTTEVAQELLLAMQNPATSLKQGNIISIWNMDLDVENTFTKGYCTYGAARISPEFFPFVEEKVQQRTWGGNAVDRCKNASDTGYKIGSIPTQGALVVYEAGGRFGSYGHVGKVLHYDKTIKKIIVRDMAWVARGTMSDRREDLATANVKCYIYNSKTALPVESIVVPPVITPPVVTTGTSTPIIVPTPVVTPPAVAHPVAPTTPPVTPPTTVTPVVPVVVTPPVEAEPTVPTLPVVVAPVASTDTIQSMIHKEVVLELDDTLLSDIAKHFITQNNLAITLVSKSPLKVGESATITLEIKDKKSGEKYSGVLPFAFSILSTNDILQSSISNIQLINNGSMDISILTQKSGTASIIISMDGTKIGEVSFEVK